MAEIANEDGVLRRLVVFLFKNSAAGLSRKRLITPLVAVLIIVLLVSDAGNVQSEGEEKKSISVGFVLIMVLAGAAVESVAGISRKHLITLLLAVLILFLVLSDAGNVQSEVEKKSVGFALIMVLAGAAMETVAGISRKYLITLLLAVLILVLVVSDAGNVQSEVEKKKAISFGFVLIMVLAGAAMEAVAGISRKRLITLLLAVLILVLVDAGNVQSEGEKKKSISVGFVLITVLAGAAVAAVRPLSYTSNFSRRNRLVLVLFTILFLSMLAGGAAVDEPETGNDGGEKNSKKGNIITAKTVIVAFVVIVVETCIWYAVAAVRGDGLFGMHGLEEDGVNQGNRLLDVVRRFNYEDFDRPMDVEDNGAPNAGEVNLGAIEVNTENRVVRYRGGEP